MLIIAGHKWEGGTLRAERSERCHLAIFSGRFSEYFYQNSLFGKRTSNQKAAAAGEYFSFAYTNRKYPTFFFINYYYILCFLPADIGARI
jgi:hypothetical protein